MHPPHLLHQVYNNNRRSTVVKSTFFSSVVFKKMFSMSLFFENVVDFFSVVSLVHFENDNIENVMAYP